MSIKEYVLERLAAKIISNTLIETSSQNDEEMKELAIEILECDGELSNEEQEILYQLKMRFEKLRNIKYGSIDELKFEDLDYKTKRKLNENIDTFVGNASK